MNQVTAIAWAAIVAALPAIGGCDRPFRVNEANREPVRAVGQASADVDQRAEAAMKKMGQVLAAAETLSFQADTVVEELAETGQMVQIHSSSRIVLRRPDRLYVERRLGREFWRLWHKGHKLAVALANANAYASADAPAANDELADHLVAKYGIELPAADFVFADPHKTMTARVIDGRWLGERDVGGVKCDHLLFTQDEIDWQIWIEKGDKPLPRKLVIDYKTETGRPQFTAVLYDWNLSAGVDDKVFDASPPAGAKQVEMADLLGGPRGK